MYIQNVRKKNQSLPKHKILTVRNKFQATTSCKTGFGKYFIIFFLIVKYQLNLFTLTKKGLFFLHLKIF